MARARQPGEVRRPTLADVARRAGVSTALASIVIREAPGAGATTRARVLRAAEELGYQPDTRARLLRSSRSRLLGVVFGVDHPFHADMVGSLYEAGARAGYDLALSAVTSRRDERCAVTSLLQDRCEALILLGPHAPATYLVSLTARLPVVVVARTVRDHALDVVRTADVTGAVLAVDHLVGLGHRRIAHVDGGRAAGAAERRRGYRQALRAHRLAGHEQLIRGGLTEEDGATAARLLMRGRLPTAITVFNDRCALGLLEALRSSQVSVPGDVSVVGYDDSSAARLSHINLTTVAQDVDEIAALSVARAIERLDGAAVTKRELIVEPHLVVRGTTGPPPS